MSTKAHSPEPKSLQRARAQHLTELFEPWSLRRLEARTGIGRSTLQSRFNGETQLTMGDIEILAPVIRMTPVELFTELLAVEERGKAPTRKGEGLSLPEMDSNHQPAGLSPAPELQYSAAADHANVTTLQPKRGPVVDRLELAPVERLGARRAGKSARSEAVSS